MSSSNTSTSDVDSINWSAAMFLEVFSYLLICLGTVGHSLSIYVFTRPTLRLNPCSRYFLASTITGIFVTYVNVPMRLIQNVYNYDIFALSSTSCKMLTFVLFWAKYLTYFEKINSIFFRAITLANFEIFFHEQSGRSTNIATMKTTKTRLFNTDFVETLIHL